MTAMQLRRELERLLVLVIVIVAIVAWLASATRQANRERSRADHNVACLLHAPDCQAHPNDYPGAP